MIKLTLTEKGGEPKVLTFDKDEITIGRVSGNDIVLPKGNVSKRHSRLLLRNGQMEISDLKSTNGTYVNGRKIAGPTPLAASDRIYVGDFLINIEGLGGAGADFADGLSSGSASSGARRMPPPPPPPRGTGAGSNAVALPEDDEETGGADEEDELGLAARPPRSGRMPIPPPPPPPPPRRGATPLANRAVGRTLDDDDGLEGLDLPMSPELGHEEDTGNVGLFAHTRRPDEDLDSAGRRSFPTGNRPGVVLPTASAGLAGATGSEPLVTAPGLDALLTDAAVTQILITGPDAVLVDRGLGFTLHDATLGDPNAVADAIWRYANTAYPPPAPDNPVVDVRLPDGTHLCAAFPPAAANGLVASIRKPVLPDRSLVDLIPGGNKDVLALFDAAIAARRSLVVTGHAAAIPAVLGALAAAIPADRRVVGIGAGGRGRSGWADLAPTADMSTLVRVAAALRADHLVVGEVSGLEVAELVLTALRGQEGVLVGMPGRGAAETLNRLAALASSGLGPAAAPTLLASAFDLVVTAVAGADGAAHIIEIAEPRLEGNILAVDLALSLHGEGSKRDPSGGRLQGRGVSSRLGAAMTAAGSPLPSAMVR